MQISSSLLVSVGVRQSDADRYVGALNIQLPKYGIDTPLRIAHFLAQVLHESAKMRAIEENLNYSASGLRRVFRKYFPTQTLAEAYARQPERIANRVYGNRLGNGPENSGDGYRYRGRGLIQLTGKDNYRRFAQWLGEDVVANPEWVAERYAVHSAVYYWDWRGLNKPADADDIRTITLRINGGLNGLPDRKKLLQKLERALASIDNNDTNDPDQDDQTTVPSTTRSPATHVVAATSLNLRSRPQLRSDTLIVSLPRDTGVIKLETADDPVWWKIQAEVNDRLIEGYVTAEYLQPLKQPPDYRVAVFLLNLRSRPEVAADTLLVRIPQNTPVARLEQDAASDWWKIQVELDGKLHEGYVAARYLTPLRRDPTHRVEATSLNVRSSPELTADNQITRINQGTLVARVATAQNPEWWKIQLQLQDELIEGYVAARYLAEI